MSQIYENSHVTLSADKSEDAYEGCFATSKSSHMSRIISFRNRSNEPYQLHYRENIGSSAAPLDRRGWAFQERILSKRIIKFMEQELEWECAGGRKCECDHIAWRVPEALSRKLQECPSISEVEKNWQSIVIQYTLRSLTYPSDIFPALQGLAKLVSPRMGRYLAGHWEASLTDSLCWYANLPTDLKGNWGRPMTWRAPTWSWASILHSVSFAKIPIGTSPSVTILNVNTIPIGTDPTGQLSYGEIVLKGLCLAGIITSPPEETLWRKVQLINNANSEIQDEALSEFYPWWDYDFESEVGMDVLAMKIYETCWLVLKRKDAHNKIYERLGVIITYLVSNTTVEQLDPLYNSLAEEMEVTII